ncbi:GRAM domain-containing protein [Heracleum sosnowskyi]|uniref:GRAM domain-containing protein n=1 Tax=Heracleum sosnowskyi TaxID=360622 RepID=A0AAD8IGM5_9APIA|nr:GRAM domain-containing protein [Heracleum sosnowskyi]
MKNQVQKNVVGIPISSAAYSSKSSSGNLLTDRNLAIKCYNPPSKANSKFNHNKLGSTTCRTNKLVGRTESFAQRIREHVRLGPKITETLKGKLSLGAKILRLGGVEKVFNKNFNTRVGEKLLKASQCYLSTTAGPIAGLLFISTDKIAFCSERTMKVSSPTGEMLRVQYKVMIPIGKIKRANKSTNIEIPSQKYIEIVTGDDYDFWFMGFLNYQRTFKYLDEAISQTQWSCN